jgi:3-(3-hydroxy-phenyl)propionate hydroxylase
METFAFAPAYELPAWPFTPPPELNSAKVVRHPLVIVGAGPAGLTLACDLAQRGVAAVLLDEDDTGG